MLARALWAVTSRRPSETLCLSFTDGTDLKATVQRWQRRNFSKEGDNDKLKRAGGECEGIDEFTFYGVREVVLCLVGVAGAGTHGKTWVTHCSCHFIYSASHKGSTKASPSRALPFCKANHRVGHSMLMD